MKVYIGNFHKLVNSTKQVPLDNLYGYDLQISDSCSVTAPVFKMRLDGTDLTNFVNFNVAYVENWGRYYFINDVVVKGSFAYIHMAEDVLATYKKEIMSSSAYVKRSASDYNLMVPDPTWTHETISHNTQAKYSIDNYSVIGCYLLVTTSDSPSTDSSLSYYVVNAEELKKLVTYVFSQDFYNSVMTGTSTDNTAIAKTFFNPFQYVVSCMWFPFNFTSFSSEYNEYIKFGWWQSDVLANKINPGVGIATQFNILNLYKTATDWTDRSNDWTKINMYIPGFGNIPIDAKYTGYAVIGNIYVDAHTGQALCCIGATAPGSTVRDNIAYVKGQIGVPFTLSSLYKSPIAENDSVTGFLNSGLMTVGKGLSYVAAKLFSSFIGDGDEIGTASGSSPVSDAIQTFHEGMAPVSTICGSTGTVVDMKYKNKVEVNVEHYNRAHDNTSLLGGVCEKVRPVSGLTGYAEFMNCTARIGGTVAEINALNALLSGGVFIE